MGSSNDMISLTNAPCCTAKAYSADGAAFNSRRLEHEPSCLRATRFGLLQDIMHWSKNPADACIFWLCGMAGTGKSTIARTVARNWDDEKRLGASFFFSRGQGDLAHASKFFTTLAYQLARTQSSVSVSVRRAILNNPDAPTQCLQDQWKHLIFEPLSRLNDVSSQIMLVIDALDECDGENDTKLILQLLSQAKILSAVRFQVFVTSRPETPIHLGFENISNAAHRDFILHTIPNSVVSHDISILFEHEFDSIRKRHDLPSEWPDKPSLDRLVQKAGGLFIYAATVCLFIGYDYSHPPERLIFVLEDTKEHRSSTALGSPTEQLDLMYTTLLRHAILQGHKPVEVQILLQLFRRIVGSIVILFDALTTSALAELLHAEQWEVKKTVRLLSSVLRYSERHDIRITLLHPSFRDFLLDNRRCGDPQFRIVGDNAHGDLAVSCLELMSRHLKQDICSLKLPGSIASEVDHSTIQRCLPLEVQYACRYWVDHLERSNVELRESESESLHNRVHAFLKEHFLHWLEALSLMEIMSKGVLMVKTFKSILPVSNPTHFSVTASGRLAVWKSEQVSKIPLPIISCCRLANSL